MAWQGEAGFGKARHGWAGHGEAWRTRTIEQLSSFALYRQMADPTISLTIGGNNVSAYFIKSQRLGHLCQPGQRAVIHLSPSVPYTIDPGMSVSLSENSTLVFTGSVVSIIRERTEITWRVEANDTYHRVTNKFLEETITTPEDARSAAYWTGYILDQTGISYSIAETGPNVCPGIELGLRTAHEALFDVMTYASWYAYPDASGVLQVGPLSSGTVSHTFAAGNNLIEYDKTTSDEQTRNSIKVFGAAGFGPTGSGRIFAKAETTIPQLTVDLVTAVGSPLIYTQGEAARVASYMLSELGSLTNVRVCTISGDPTVKIGDTCRVTHDADGFTDNATGVCTSLISTIDENGYVMEVTLGERCPRIAGWSLTTPPLYAGTSGSGVFKSTDDGLTWTAMNNGLPSGNKYVRRIGFNALEEGMGIINGRLYYYNGTTWTQKSLPAGQNMAGDPSPLLPTNLVAVDATGAGGSFAVLAGNPNSSGSNIQRYRSWIYETINAGTAWTSTQLQSSGSGYHAVPLDLTSRYGIPYAVITSGSSHANLAIMPFTSIERTTLGGVFSWSCRQQIYGVHSWRIANIYQTGVAPNRVLTVTIAMDCFKQGLANQSVNARFVCNLGYDMLFREDEIPFNPITPNADYVAAPNTDVSLSGSGWETVVVNVNFNEAEIGGTLFSARLRMRYLDSAPTPPSGAVESITGADICYTVSGPTGHSQYNAAVLLHDFDVGI